MPEGGFLAWVWRAVVRWWLGVWSLLGGRAHGRNAALRDRDVDGGGGGGGGGGEGDANAEEQRRGRQREREPLLGGEARGADEELAARETDVRVERGAFDELEARMRSLLGTGEERAWGLVFGTWAEEDGACHATVAATTAAEFGPFAWGMKQQKLASDFAARGCVNVGVWEAQPKSAWEGEVIQPVR